MEFENSFLENLIENDRAKNTIDSYLSDIKLFETFINKSIEPVSYTHLRAHETVLDLVCRLLLAKKHP